jgi:N-acetylglucosamine kinase-like BadF-type ATPase
VSRPGSSGTPPGDVLLAVDGGNTKTVAIAAGLDGKILGTGAASCSNIYAPLDWQADPLGELEGAAREALAAAGAGGGDVAFAVLSLSGADWPEDFDYLADEARRRLGLRHCLILNDAIGALRCGTPDAVGVSAICGTSGALGARRADGATWHLGFWPRRSAGHALGHEALRAVEEAGLELAPPTSLTPVLTALHGAGDGLGMTHTRTQREGRVRLLPPALASIVLDEAEAGDAVARGIVSGVAHRLGEYSAVCARRLGMFDQPYTLVLAGGLLRHPSRLIPDTIARLHPNATAVCATVEPGVGALLWALDLAGADVQPHAVAATLPPGLFRSAR